jgi:rfaE bifunctional protein nucleotidyltransferase chain/domain
MEDGSQENMNTRYKILDDIGLVKMVNYLTKKANPISLATGVFDILHVGHKRLLEEAVIGDEYLFVGINSDRAVKMLKGHDRPINSEMDRAEMMAALQCVGYVFIIDSTRVTDAIRTVRPTKWYKGGDYTLQTLNKEEVKAANEVGADIVIVPATAGYSTTSILSRI